MLKVVHDATGANATTASTASWVAARQLLAATLRAERPPTFVRENGKLVERQDGQEARLNSVTR
jgi:hypothetical protein